MHIDGVSRIVNIHRHDYVEQLSVNEEHRGEKNKLESDLLFFPSSFYCCSCVSFVVFILIIHNHIHSHAYRHAVWNKQIESLIWYCWAFCSWATENRTKSKCEQYRCKVGVWGFASDSVFHIRQKQAWTGISTIDTNAVALRCIYVHAYIKMNDVMKLC